MCPIDFKKDDIIMKLNYMNKVCLFGVVMSASAQAEEITLPNVVIVLSDDLGYGCVGSYGADPKLVKTPNIDLLAKEGMRFTDACTPSSVCTPTRYALLTGRYCWRSRLKAGVSNTYDPLLIEPERPNLARLMKKKGYATAVVGKWHLGYGNEKRVDYTKELKPGPLELGFDYQFAVPQNNGDITGVYVENHKVAGLRSEKLKTDMPKCFYGRPYAGIDAPQRNESENMPILTEKAVAWLQKVPKGKPFFLYFAATAVHAPIWPSQSVKGKTGGGDFTDFILELDETVKRLMQVLKKKGVDKNTLFIFTSDNGGVIITSKKNRNQSILKVIEKGLKINGDLRGSKHSIFQGGFNVPFIVRWPETVKPDTTCKAMINLVDIYATMADILGVPLPDKSKGAEDSFSFLPQLKNPEKPGERKSMILHSACGNFAIRQGPWKYIEGMPFSGYRRGKYKKKKNEDFPQFYSLMKDPSESNNLIKSQPEKVRELSETLRTIRSQGYSR